MSSEKTFVDHLANRFVLPVLLLCVLCVACFATYTACRWLLAPPADTPVSAFYTYMEKQASHDRLLLTRGDLTPDEALKRRSQHDTVYAYLSAFLQSPR